VKKIFSGHDFESISKLYNFSKKSADEIHWGTGLSRSSFSARFHQLGNRPLFVVRSDGILKISTEYPKRDANQEQIINLDKLNLAMKNVGVNINPESERTAFTIDEWSNKVNVIIKTISEVIK